MGLQKNCCPRRRWGKTELSIPVIPFGTQGFGGHFGPVDDEEAMALMRRPSIWASITSTAPAATATRCAS